MNERERLAKIIESEKLTAKQFAEMLGVSAGTISNILSERNKPSVDIYVRILNCFRTISPDWLMLGTGSMYRPNGGVTQAELFGDLRPELPSDTPASADRTAVSMPAQPLADKPAYSLPDKPARPAPVSAPKQIARIIIYYTDGTYEER